MLTQWLRQLAPGLANRTPRHVSRFLWFALFVVCLVSFAPLADAYDPAVAPPSPSFLTTAIVHTPTPAVANRTPALASQPLRILMYHYIRDGVPASDQLGRNLSVTPPDFDAQMRFLAEHNYDNLTLDDLLEARDGGKPLPAKAVALTFDDGYADFYEQAWPILQKYNLRATIYVITGKVGQLGYLTWAQIAELLAKGVTVGAHTVTHPRLTTLSEPALFRELRESQRQLEAVVGSPVHHFAYPSGAFDVRVRAATQASGYLTATTTRPGTAALNNDPLALPRLRVSGGMTLARFAALLGERQPDVSH